MYKVTVAQLAERVIPSVNIRPKGPTAEGYPLRGRGRWFKPSRSPFGPEAVGYPDKVSPHRHNSPVLAPYPFPILTLQGRRQRVTLVKASSNLAGATCGAQSVPSFIFLGRRAMVIAARGEGRARLTPSDERAGRSHSVILQIKPLGRSFIRLFLF